MQAFTYYSPTKIIFGKEAQKKTAACIRELQVSRVLIVYGSDRTQAIDRMRRALAETLFEGVVTGTDYQMHILCSKAFVDANFNVKSIANGDFEH